MMEYKVAILDNLEEIISIKNKVKEQIIEENLLIWQNGYPQDELLHEDIEKGFGRVIVVDEQIVAYASYYPALYDYDPGTFPIDDVMSFGRIMTKVTERNKGYASFLVKSMLDEARQNKIPGFGILVDSFNKKALSIYIKSGFKYIRTSSFPWAVLDVYYLDFSDEC